MKNLFFTFIFCLLSLLTFAQKVTEQNLQGTWKLSTYTVQGVSVDIETGKMTVSKEVEASASPEFISQFKESLKQFLEPLKTGYIYITGNNIRQILGDVVKDGPFTIEEKNGSQVIAANFDDGSSAKIPVDITDGKLHIFERRSQKEFIYTHQ